MFPKNKIDLLYRLLCLVCYLAVLLVINSVTSIIVLFIIYCVLSVGERSYRNLVLIVISILVLGICYYFDNYWLLKICLMVDYIIYFIDTSYYIVEEEEMIVDQNKYLRFNYKKKKKGSRNTVALYLTIHLVLLFLAIMVG